MCYYYFLFDRSTALQLLLTIGLYCFVELSPETVTTKKQTTASYLCENFHIRNLFGNIS